MSIELPERICPRCGSNDWETGRVHSPEGLNGSPIFFRLSKTPFLTLRSANIKIEAVMCMNCGLIEMTGNAEYARKLLGR